MAREVDSRIPQEVIDFLDTRERSYSRGGRGGKPASSRQFDSVSGGSISTAFKVASGSSTLFIKTHAEPPLDMYAIEAESLDLLRGAVKTERLVIPEVLFQSENALVMSFVEIIRGDAHAEALAEGLAEIHRQTQDEFGYSRDTYCGLTLQNNTRTTDGHEFFAERRLLYLARLCYDMSRISRQDMKALERLLQDLPSIVPQQAASLLHGDLWTGNQFGTTGGRAVLIDPAISYGWREADIAATMLFGALPEAFYARYEDCWRMEADWRQRVPVYNLYHWLNHLLMFGDPYSTAVQAILKPYRA
ncbi:fructosamine kinase family protein [Allohahella marinimesophila]|uniref:Fructosamine kinase family protein n=1 Tax=Allohahella marinimesophila TaxID=1054972 RepID=A0ABP7NGU8_9GAMM